MRLHPADRVLLRLPSWIGDAVAAEPAARALHAFLDPARGGRLTLAAPPGPLALFEGRFEGAGRAAPDGAGWRGHDTALLLTGSFRSAWTALRAGIPRRVGLARDGRSPLLTLAVAPPRERGGAPLGIGRAGRPPRLLPRSVAAGAAELLSALGTPPADPLPRLWAPPEALRRVRERLAGAGLAEGAPFLLVNAGGRPGSAKAFPQELFRRALELALPRAGVRAVLVAGPGEEAGARRLAAALGERARALLDPPVGLGELVALCGLARGVLTPDSGPLHVAAAAGARSVAVHGPTDPRHGLGSVRAARAVRTVVPCGPCHAETCPLAGERALCCTGELRPEPLAQAVLELLDPREPRDP